MGTPQNTAAIYIRKSSTDNRSGSNRSLSNQRHECPTAAEREGLTIVRTYEQREILSVLVDQVAIERRYKPSADIKGRTILAMATGSNVIDLASRFGDEPRPAEVTAKTA
jgi:hypothetical protein